MQRSTFGWGVGLLLAVGCTSRDEAAAKPTAPKVVGHRIAERDLAKEPPFVGEHGMDSYGYPRKRPDKMKLLALLRLKRFDDLDRFMTSLPPTIGWPSR